MEVSTLEHMILTLKGNLEDKLPCAVIGQNIVGRPDLSGQFAGQSVILFDFQDAPWFKLRSTRYLLRLGGYLPGDDDGTREIFERDGTYEFLTSTDSSLFFDRVISCRDDCDDIQEPIVAFDDKTEEQIMKMHRTLPSFSVLHNYPSGHTSPVSLFRPEGGAFSVPVVSRWIYLPIVGYRYVASSENILL